MVGTRVATRVRALEHQAVKQASGRWLVRDALVAGTRAREYACKVERLHGQSRFVCSVAGG